MSECHHYTGGLCIVCGAGTNFCCGEGINCEVCNNEICQRCYTKKNNSCPVCSQEIVTNDQVLTFLLKKYNLEIDAIKEEYRKNSY